MYVFWNSLDEFFDFIIQRLEKSRIVEKIHFIDDLKEFLENKK